MMIRRSSLISCWLINAQISSSYRESLVPFVTGFSSSCPKAYWLYPFQACLNAFLITSVRGSGLLLDFVSAAEAANPLMLNKKTEVAQMGMCIPRVCSCEAKERVPKVKDGSMLSYPGWKWNALARKEIVKRMFLLRRKKILTCLCNSHRVKMPTGYFAEKRGFHIGCNTGSVNLHCFDTRIWMHVFLDHMCKGQ